MEGHHTSKSVVEIYHWLTDSNVHALITMKRKSSINLMTEQAQPLTDEEEAVLRKNFPQHLVTKLLGRLLWGKWFPDGKGNYLSDKQIQEEIRNRTELGRKYLQMLMDSKER